MFDSGLKVIGSEEGKEAVALRILVQPVPFSRIHSSLS